jgi:hypothetical protein
MRKQIAVTAAVALIASSFLSSSYAAAPKVGSACTKVGAFYDTPNTRYVCKQEGSKKVWRVWSPTTANTPSASAKPVNFKARIPITLPVAQSKNPADITFANILDHISEIPNVAWQKVQDVIAANPTVTQISNEVHVGPNTKIDVVGGLPRIQELLLRTQRLFNGFTQNKTFYILMYNAQDEPWAENDWEKTAKAKKYFANVTAAEKLRIRGNCQKSSGPGVFSGPPVDCRGANSTAITNSDDANFSFGQGGEGAANDPYVSTGGIVGHEYIHALQAAQWIGHPNSYCTEKTETASCFRSWSSNFGFSPCWIFEGLPNSVGPMVASETYASYQEYRKNLPYRGPTTVTDYTQASLKKYLYNQLNTTCYQDGKLYDLGYSVGALATEALVAIAGPQATLALYSLGAQGQDFATAFKNVYGISWSDASTILSKVLAAQYATFGPPPKD